jgi:hypothetical protein
MTEGDPTSETPPIDWDQRISIAEAAAICGLDASLLRRAASAYHKDPTQGLHVERSGGINLTTRRWLDDFLRQRERQAPTKRHRARGRPPKPLPPDYQAPPRRGRPPKARSAPLSEPARDIRGVAVENRQSGHAGESPASTP